jgi:hypothetical protein
MDPAQIAQDRYSWDVLAVERQNTGRVRIQMALLLGEGDWAMMLVLSVVGGGDSCKEPCYHLDNVRDWHRTDFILLPCIDDCTSRATP